MKNDLWAKATEGQYKNFIRKHWTKDIVFTDIWPNNQTKLRLGTDKLLPGEIEAFTFTLGCYTIRSARRVYKLNDNERYIPGCVHENAEPASKEELASYMKNQNEADTGCAVGVSYAIRRPGISTCEDIANKNFYEDTEIMARHNTDPESVFAGGFKYVCSSNRKSGTFTTYGEGISHIFTIKEKIHSDKCASLFVLKEWMGSSFNGERWYRLDPNGDVSEFQNHPLDTNDEGNMMWENDSEVFWYYKGRGSCVPFKKNGKCGYAYYDTDVVMVEPQWDAALPFNDFGFGIVLDGISIEEIMSEISASNTASKELKDYIPESVIENCSFKAGLINEEGEIILPVIFEAIGDFDNHHVLVKQSGKWGALGLRVDNSEGHKFTGKVVLPIEYDEVINWGGYLFVKKSGKWGIFGGKGEKYVDTILTEYPDPYRRKGFYMLLQKGDKYGFMHMLGDNEVYLPSMTKKEALAIIEKLELESDEK